MILQQINAHQAVQLILIKILFHNNVNNKLKIAFYQVLMFLKQKLFIWIINFVNNANLKNIFIIFNAYMRTNALIIINGQILMIM